MNFGDFPNLLFESSTIDDGNMSLLFGDKEEVSKNRREFLKKLDVEQNSLSILNLEHKDNVSNVSKEDLDKELVSDAIITKDKSLFIGILTADCLPIAIFDPTTSLISLVHLSVNNYSSIVDKTINRLMAGDVDTKNLIVEIGPSIGPCHYKMDLWSEAEDLLARNGVKKENITNNKICTFESNYFSHRRSSENGDKEGRFLSVLGVTK